MATWGDIKTAVTYNLGKQGDANIVTLLPIWADLFQKKVQQDRNYWFLKTVAERTINNTAQSYPLPANFKADMVFYLKRLVTSGDPANAFIELDPITDIDVVRTYEPVTAQSQKAQPEAYTIGNVDMTLWPWPDKTYTLRCQYWKDIDPPVAGSAAGFINAWITNYPALYIAALSAEGFKYLQEWADADAWEKRAIGLLLDVRASHIARELPSKVMLVPMRDQFGTTRDSQNSVWKVYN